MRSVPRSSNLTATFRGHGPKHLPGSIPSARATASRGHVGTNSSTTPAVFSTARFVRSQLISAGSHGIFSAPVTDHPVKSIMGSLWLLNGGKLVMLEARTATIETPAGLRRTWRRKLGGPGRLARWEQLP
jgi:hypothetical protein